MGVTALFSLLIAAGAAATTLDAQPPKQSSLPDPGLAGLLNKGITALGGEVALRSIKGVTYGTPFNYRSQTVMQNYDLFKADRYIAISGHQNVSLAYTDDGTLEQRIDRFYQVSESWYWAQPLLQPRNYTLVVKSGKDGYACYTKGNNVITLDTATVQGYVAAPLAEYYTYQALKMSPNLLTKINVTSSYLATLDNGVKMPAINDAALNISIIFDPTTFLPYIIRSYEEHQIFGPSVSDLQIYNYTKVNGVLFPQHLVSLYNGAIVEDVLISSITVNPTFPTNYFAGLSTGAIPPPAAPVQSLDYGHAELGEFSSNMIWRGEYTGTAANLSATNPIASLPNLWLIAFSDAPTYRQWVIVFDDAVIVADAPPHQSALIRNWVKNKLGKSVTHLWISHHHHDHSYATHEYVAAGVPLIVPEISVPLWSSIPNAKIISYSHSAPFIHKDSKMQVRFMWETNPAHSEDWSYGIVAPTACPAKGAGSNVAVFETDVWNPGFPELTTDQAQARIWLDQLVRDGLPKDALVTAAHGVNAPLTTLIDFLGYPYPNHTTADWKAGGRLC